MDRTSERQTKDVKKKNNDRLINGQEHRDAERKAMKTIEWGKQYALSD
jgi:hypothetical protein